MDQFAGEVLLNKVDGGEDELVGGCDDQLFVALDEEVGGFVQQEKHLGNLL